ncbi:SdpI/YhfL protein family protein [Andreprevotia lacus DSM 23236]|jgi:ABC-type phosphate transport system permease subunit|uniref:SdpI/YhfL protein family protein n=1 Tax=Andreprevotia lacus DSM 23236 TaxID=1121001 RepID=A0A1W1XEN8_9NEIS|nr:SdpI family protein [Andreprevotia lacus]SMC21971.1 SdpI/YhfL protein family protein [Andreprevotia lacus DSM 23236]
MNDFLISPLLFACGLVALLSVPLIMRWVPVNGLFGVRTRRTVRCIDNWYRANHFGGWAILIGSLISAILLVLIPMAGEISKPAYIALFAVPELLAATVALAYTYRLPTPPQDNPHGAQIEDLIAQAYPVHEHTHSDEGH